MASIAFLTRENWKVLFELGLRAHAADKIVEIAVMEAPPSS